MDARVTLPLLLLAETANPGEPWWNLLINGGIATGVIGWFMWRDKQDREERKQAQADHERRHNDHIAQQKKIEDAFRTTTDSLIIAMSAMKTIDNGYADLLARMKATNGTEK